MAKRGAGSHGRSECAYRRLRHPERERGLRQRRRRMANWYLCPQSAGQAVLRAIRLRHIESGRLLSNRQSRCVSHCRRRYDGEVLSERAGDFMDTNIDRRSALLLLGSALLPGAAASATASSSESKAGASKFLWGSAGAAYQIEGSNYASDLWVMEHTQPSIFKDPSGDAVDAYHRVDEDIALAASLGFNTHRFSIEWSRIESER